MLCDVCDRISFRRHVNEPMRSRISLGEVREIHRESRTCPFCFLVWRCIRRSPVKLSSHSKIYLTNRKSWKQCIVFAPYEGRTTERYSTTREVTANAEARTDSTVYRFVLLDWYDREVGEIQHIPRLNLRSTPFASGRNVDQDHANMELIRRWLNQCNQVHGVFCEESGGAARTLPHIRVIDVQSGSIIEAPHPCRYIALSYVWGSSNTAQLKKKDLRFDDRGSPFARLPRELPQTIEDAIQVTKSLGERYLWVDSLCIIQDSAPDKRMQMEHMDAIYSSAFVTIAAASGSEANVGLAGISRPRAVAQDVEFINGSEYAIPFPAYMSLMSDPSIAWNTRGWTFQEKILSKRLLAFTDYQVYFQCSNMVWYEDTAMETEGTPDRTQINWRPLRWAADRTPHSPQDGLELRTVAQEFIQEKLGKWSKMGPVAMSVLAGSGWLWKGDGTLVSGLRNSKYTLRGLANDKQMGQVALVAMNRVRFLTYISAIKEYTRRRLTHQEDGINAVQGVLRTLSAQWGAFHSGLPESHLAPALLWGPPVHGVASKHWIEEAPFPSWSWARWRFPEGLAWQTPKPSWAKLERTAFLLSPSGLVELSSPSASSDNKTPNISYESLSPGAQTLLSTIGEMLYMKCTPIQVRVGGTWIGTKGENETGDTINEYDLRLPTGAVIGHIRMSVEEREFCGDELQELVTICWSIGYDGPKIPGYLVPTKRVSDGENSTKTVNMEPKEYPVASVFLVKWMDEVAERVAVGHVVSTGWELCKRKPRWMVFG